MATDLVAWLRQQLDADAERRLSVHDLDCELTASAGWHGPCTCGLPDHIEREVDAKRRIIDEHYPTDPCDAHDASLRSIPCATLRLLALPDADRPGYREEWRP